MKKEKILLIGAGGQLGSELAQGLWKFYGKENVIATDIKEPQGILKQGNFEILDVLNPKNLSSILQKISSPRFTI
jgi:dTDP-4-dehydrorhamnose reductase